MTADMRTELATLLYAMREVVATGRKAERRVAQVILDDVGLSARSSIGEIARRAQVSEPTVTRLCRTLGCNGTRDLKLRLAGALYSGVSYLQDITPTDDDVAAIKRKVVGGFLSRGALNRIHWRGAWVRYGGRRRAFALHPIGHFRVRLRRSPAAAYCGRNTGSQRRGRGHFEHRTIT